MAPHSSTPQTKKIIEALWKLEKIILDSLDFKVVVQNICDGLLTELDYLKLGYRIIVLTLVDQDKKVIKRISLSQTKEAEKAQKVSAVPFHQIDIPLSAKENLLVKTYRTHRPHRTHFWPDLFRPTLTDEQALANQRAAGIKTSMTYPIIVKNKVIGVVIFSLVKDAKDISTDEKDLIRGFLDIVGIAIQNAKLYTRLDETTAKLKIANQKLKELDRLKDDFVSVASHELRTPMTAIKSYLWMALSGQGGRLQPKQKFYLERSYQSTDRLIRLVNDMLNISRIESGRISLELNRVNLPQLVAEVIDEVRPRADELRVKVTMENLGKFPEVIADADKIREVITNLIGNSIKFTPSGGFTKITFYVDGNLLVTKITDNGAGLDEVGLSNLFQKFGLIKGSYQTNKLSTQGTGLGLYICRQIVELHHGKIWATSGGLGLGTQFMFSLPIYTPLRFRQYKKAFQHQSAVGIIHNKL